MWIDGWQGRGRKGGGCGILELRLGPGRASSGEERQPLVWLGEKGWNLVKSRSTQACLLTRDD